jgi:hypothetical protein
VAGPFTSDSKLNFDIASMAKKQRLSHKKQHRSVSSNPVGRPKAVKAINNKPAKLTREIIAQMLWHDDYYPLLTNFVD